MLILRPCQQEMMGKAKSSIVTYMFHTRELLKRENTPQKSLYRFSSKEKNT